jgi:DNA-nicking Smr family endonuclease
MLNIVDSEIDLHGLSHLQALEETENKLLLVSQNLNFRFNIITGNSSSLQKKIIKNILDKYKFNYYVPSSNLGKIVVFS